MNPIQIVTNHLSSSTFPSQDHHISTDSQKQYVDIVIDRAQKNNTLTSDMAKKMHQLIQCLNNVTQVKVVFFRKSEGPAFCGGGDLEYIMKDTSEYNYQYEINKFIFLLSQAKATTIAFLDGLVKGSGVGFSFFAKIKIATENSLLALPEARFGYITDAGGGYYLPRLNDGLGLFMMLTGTPIKGEDLVRTGLAHYYVQSSKLESLRKEIQEYVIKTSEDSVNEESLRKIVEKYSQEVKGEYSLRSFIKENFEGKNSIEEIFSTLKEKVENDETSKSILEVMKVNSPMGLKANLELYKKGIKMSLEEVLKLEWSLGRKLRAHVDVITSVQKAPLKQEFEWSHKTVEEVKNEEIEELFKIEKTQPEF